MRSLKYAGLIGLFVLVGCKGCKKGGGSDNPIRDQVTVESCGNGEDDNGDGWTDCQDPVCQLEEACVFEPPDPADLAPPDDPTSQTDFADSIRFLWEGDNPVVRGLDPEALDMDRVSVVRGEILDRDGEPVSGVRANIAGRREYGYTFSRDDGRIDLVVNGGEAVHVRVDGENLLAVDREVAPDALEYDWAADIVMTPIDENANPIELDGENQVARGSTSSDDDGERTARLYVPPNTRATVRLPDGQEATLEKNATIRLTEYTVGETGDEAMPAFLPEDSAYTYALELSVDEARDVNAEEVRFNHPVYLYVDNFLDFPVGSPVPSGFYLRSSTVWEPNPNGVVMQRTEDGVSVSESGDSAAVGVRQFLDLSAAEMEIIEENFDVGETFWRVPVIHFSPCDLNWPYEFPEDAVSPDEIPEEFNDPDPCAEAGSTIECQNQALMKHIQLPGTPFNLTYRSDRVSGSGRYFEVPVTYDSPPESLQKAVVEVELAGRFWREEFGPEPNQNYAFEWDGKDGYGRKLSGEWPIEVKVHYYYEVDYTEPPPQRAFAQAGGERLNDGRLILPISRTYRGLFGALDSLGTLGMGGWALDIQHVYDSTRRAFHPGSAPERNAQDVSRVVEIFETFGDADHLPYPPRQYHAGTIRVEMGPDGALYILFSALTGGNYIIRRLPDGTLEPVVGRAFDDPSERAGVGCHMIGNCGEGGPLDEAILLSNRFDVGPEGEIYIGHGTCLWRVKDGEFEGFDGDNCGENVQRPDGSLDYPNVDAFTVLPGGDLALSDSNEVFRLDVETHRVTKLAGCTGDDCEAPGPAPRPGNEVEIDAQFLVAGDDGTIYFANRYDGAVGAISADGQVHNIVRGDEDDDLRALEFGEDGGLYALVYRELGAEIRRVVGHDWQKLAGRSFSWWEGIDVDHFSFLAEEGEPIPANTATLLPFGNIAVDADGEVFLTTGTPHPDEDAENDQIPALQRVYDVLPAVGDTDDTILAAPSGTRLYRFDKHGRIQAVLDPLDFSEDFTFEYTDGYVTAITDRWGNTTAFNRDGKTLESVVGPWGHETTFHTTETGYADEIVFPDGSSVTADYTEHGLMTAFSDGEGNTSTYEYTSGDLTRAEDPTGGWKTLTKYRDGSVELETSTGRTVKYGEPPSFRNRFEYVTVDSRGLEWHTFARPGYSKVITRPDGTELETLWRADPRFGVQAKYVGRARTKTPSGLEQTHEVRREAEFGDREDFSTLQTLTERSTLGEREWTRVYDAESQTLTLTTPAGRRRVDTFDEHGRLASIKHGDLDAAQFLYDEQGMLIELQQGSDAVRYSRGSDGFVESITTTRSGTREYERDANGRVVATTTAGGRQTYGWDANDAPVSVDPPGPTAAFQQSFNSMNLIESRTWPDGSTREFSYGDGHRLSTVTPPSGRQISISYDEAGRVVSSTTDDGVYSHEYDPETGQLIASDTPFVESTFGWDGFLLVQRDRTVEGIDTRVTRTFDDDFHMTNRSAAGAAIGFTHDLDGNVTSAGPVTLDYRPDVSLISGISVGSVETTVTHDSAGVVTGRSHSGPGGFQFEESYVRDGAKYTEITSDGTTRTYRYDDADRLVEVLENGTPVHTYGYGEWGYRTSIDGTELTLDENGRVTSFGTTTYTWDADGNLASATSGGETTNYEFNARGSLVGVSNSTGELDYRVDSLGRRVAQLRDGVLERVWVYDDFYRPIAELDGNGDLRSRFVYGSSSWVPDAMVRNGTNYRFVYDHRLSVRRVVNASTGEVAQALEYDPLGRIISDTNPGFQPFGFVGGLHDGELGLVHLGTRTYDTTVGRWISPDQRRLAGSETLLYAYGAGDPVNTIDPRGDVWVLVVVGGGLVVATGFLLHQDHIKNESAEAGLRAYQGEGLSAGPTNQIRHCTWQCMETRVYGESIASGMGDYHENPDIPGELWGGDEDNQPGNPDREADERANNCGQRQGKHGDPDKSCEELCNEAFRRGEMPPAAPEHWVDHPDMADFIRKKKAAGGKVGAGTYNYTPALNYTPAP